MQSNFAACSWLVLFQQEAQQEHQRGNHGEQPVDINIREGLSLGDNQAVHSGEGLLLCGMHAQADMRQLNRQRGDRFIEAS